MRVDDFDYPLPPDLIAQQPAPCRDASRLLVLNRSDSALSHHVFTDLPNLLRTGDLLVVNDSRVIPARLRARKPGSGGQVELLLVEETRPLEWWTLLRPGKRVHPGSRLEILNPEGHASLLSATVLEKSNEGLCRVRIEGTNNLYQDLEHLGEVPLPPYIDRSAAGPLPDDRQRYQTVYARDPGSVAAPTAGLHFSETLVDRLRQCHIDTCSVTLHVGLGTFAPIKVDNVEDHLLHTERYEITPESASTINTAIRQGRRIVAVGTTTVRVLESVAARHQGTLVAERGSTRLFLYPPADFLIVKALITNFHLPKSSLLMLVSAFTAPGQPHGRTRLLQAYAEAVRNRYRFFSYGDAMLIQ